MKLYNLNKHAMSSKIKYLTNPKCNEPNVPFKVPSKPKLPNKFKAKTIQLETIFLSLEIVEITKFYNFRR